MESQKDFSPTFAARTYDLRYEINPEQRMFRSTQDIALTNVSGKSTDWFSFLLHPDLLVDGIALRDAQGCTLPVKNWRAGGLNKIFRNTLQTVQVEMSIDIVPGQELDLHLEYHMSAERFGASPPEADHILDLTLCERICYAVGPHSGHYAVFNDKLAAPFHITIAHPETYACCVPGHLISSSQEGGNVVETYDSPVPNIPAFSCGQYEKTIRRVADMTFEYYLYPGQPFFDEMASLTAQFVQLYISVLGDLDTDTYRFGTVGARDSGLPAWENKGNAIYFTDLATRYYGQDAGARAMYAGLVSHELVHNWNLFSLYWTGPLAEWFGEGGANFLGAWANERLLGEDAGVAGRAHFCRAFDGEQGFRGYDAKETLLSVQKTVGPELMLIYYYGALVWEQLRQKIGDEALFAGLGDFFQRYRGQEVTYLDFFQCLQGRTDARVADYLQQWIDHNARIELTIGNVNIWERDGRCQAEVEVVVVADHDYELFTSLGYRTASRDEMDTIDLHLTRCGTHTIAFESDAKPVYIQIDPAFRVPQINLDSNTWNVQKERP